MKTKTLILISLLFFAGQVFAADAIVNSISFDGTNDYISVSDNNSLELGNGDFTISAWVNFASLANSPVIIAKWAASSNERSFLVYYRTNDGTISFTYTPNGTSTTYFEPTWTPTLNTWYHIVWERSGSDMKCYINGSQLGQTFNIGGATLHSNSANVVIGNDESTPGNVRTYWFNGSMASVKIIKTAGVVDSLYNSGKPRVHRGYGASIRTNTVLAIEGGENLPTNLYQDDFDLLTGLKYNASYDSGTYSDAVSNTITNVNTTDKEIVINGKDSIGFNGTNAYQSINSLSTTYNGSYEGYIVFKKESSSYDVLASWLQYSNADSYSFINPRRPSTNDTRFMVEKSGAVNGTDAIEPTSLGDEWGYYRYSFNNSTLTSKISLNGGSEISVSQTSQFNTNDQVNRGAIVRTGNSSGVSFLNGQIAQDILFDSVNSSADQKVVENLLIAKFFPLHDLSTNRNKVSVQGVIMTGTQITFDDEEDGAANYYNLTLGTNAGLNNTGIGNTFLGSNAGFNNTAGENNVFIGSFAGYNETGSNKLYIANSDTATPLIYGEFDNQKLQVNGELRVTGGILANKVHVKLAANWPDYVFAKDYKLPSLEEVENHINEHKHLPGIPSAKEIETGTLSVDEVMVKQMEKIEELTLYILKLKKQNEQFKKQNDAILERLNALEKAQK